MDVLDRTAWQSERMIEVPFLAADAEGGELAFAGAAHLLAGAVLFTGNHGDKIWNKNPEVPISSRIIGGGASGLSLTEYRLMIGMIHVPVPYIGISRMKDVVAISRSSEMSSWDLQNDYNRPVCRRILEDAGVPRSLFGMKKKAMASLFRHGDVFLTRKSRIDLANWLDENSVGVPNRAQRASAVQALLRYSFLPEIAHRLERFLRRFLLLMPHKYRLGIEWRLVKIRCLLNKQVNVDVPWAFPWAIERMSDRYRGGPNRMV